MGKRSEVKEEEKKEETAVETSVNVEGFIDLDGDGLDDRKQAHKQSEHTVIVNPPLATDGTSGVATDGT